MEHKRVPKKGGSIANVLVTKHSGYARNDRHNEEVKAGGVRLGIVETFADFLDLFVEFLFFFVVQPNFFLGSSQRGGARRVRLPLNPRM